MSGTLGRLSHDAQVVSAYIIREDIEETDHLSDNVLILVNAAYAHVDPRGVRASVKHGDLDASLDNYNRLACKYVAFLTGDGYTSLEAVVQYVWKAVFRHPL